MNGTIKPIPLKESEAREIQLLWGVMEILSETSPRLKKRLQACGRWRQLRTCAAWMGRIVGDVMDTIEPPKRRKFMLNLENQEMRIVCKACRTPRRATPSWSRMCYIPTSGRQSVIAACCATAPDATRPGASCERL